MSRARLLVLAASAAVLGLVAPASVRASCAGPTLEVPGAAIRYPTVVADDAYPVTLLPQSAGRIVVTRSDFTDETCNDIPSTQGCGSPRSVPAKPPRPVKRVTLLLTHGDRAWPLGEADARSTEAGAPSAGRWGFRQTCNRDPPS